VVFVAGQRQSQRAPISRLFLLKKVVPNRRQKRFHEEGYAGARRRLFIGERQ